MWEIVIDFIIHGIIALCIAVPFGTFHEYLHMRKAKQLGCKVSKGKRFKNETIVDTTDPIFIKKIGNAPYVVLVPLALLILAVGVYFMHVGIIIGSSGTLLIHAISYPLEGRDEKHKSEPD